MTVNQHSEATQPAQQEIDLANDFEKLRSATAREFQTYLRDATYPVLHLLLRRSGFDPQPDGHNLEVACTRCGESVLIHPCSQPVFHCELGCGLRQSLAQVLASQPNSGCTLLRVEADLAVDPRTDKPVDEMRVAVVRAGLRRLGLECVAS